MIQFPFDERKTAHAAAHLLSFCGGALPSISLIQMLYLADRRTLLDIGQPITGARLVSMDYGPAVSEVFDLIRFGHAANADGNCWRRYISPPSKDSLAKDSLVKLEQSVPEVSELSDYEIDVLRAIADEYNSTNRWDVVDRSHELPEWLGSVGISVAIAPEKILRLEGRPDEEIERVAEAAQELLLIRQLAPKLK